MDHSQKRRNIARKARVFRVRKRLHGTAEMPRLSVFKTNAHLYAQLIDDETSRTLLGVGTLSKTNQKTQFNRRSKDSARHLGKEIAEKAKALKVERVVFDRGRYKFHGIIAELANAAREAGLQF